MLVAERCRSVSLLVLVFNALKYLSRREMIWVPNPHLSEVFGRRSLTHRCGPIHLIHAADENPNAKVLCLSIHIHQIKEHWISCCNDLKICVSQRHVLWVSNLHFCGIFRRRSLKLRCGPIRLIHAADASPTTKGLVSQSISIKSKNTGYQFENALKICFSKTSDMGLKSPPLR